MFNKSNGRALTVANVILLAQFILSMIGGIWILAYFLFPTDKSSGDVHLLVQSLAPGLIALALGFIVNKVFKIFDKDLAYEHKLFNLISLLVVDEAICSIIMKLNDQAAGGIKGYDSSLNSELSSIITYIAAVALTYKIPMFKNEYSKTLNTINLFCYFGFIFNFAWMLSTIILGVGKNDIAGADVFAHILIGLSLLGVIIYLVKNAKKLSGSEEAAEPKKVEAVKETKSSDSDIKAELEATRQELKELKELLKEKKD